MRRGGLACSALALSLLAPAEGTALSGFAPEARTLWLELGGTHWAADSQYAGPFGLGELGYEDGRDIGDRIPLSIDEDGGRFRSSTAFVAARVTPIASLSLGAYFPYLQVSELELPSTRTRTVGTGDAHVWAAYHAPPFGERVATTIAFHAKVPTTRASFESLSVPLSEGQVDLAVEQQTSWRPVAGLQISGSLLWRYRFAVERKTGGTQVRVKPGNETEVSVEVAGAPHPLLWLRATYAALFAQASEDRTVRGFVSAVEQRQVHNVELGAYFSFGDAIRVDGLALDAWVRHPLGGVDFLRGPSVGGGLAYTLPW